jgi:metal-responsive CopG/Arc/MetJ family transcriptional regulator
MNHTNIVQIHTKLPKTLADKIDIEAKNIGCSRSAIIKQKLAEIYFKNETNENRKSEDIQSQNSNSY